MDGFDWVFSLTDEMSGGAASIVKELKSLKAGLAGAEKASKGFDGGLDKIHDLQLDVAVASKKLTKAENELAKSLKEAGDQSGELSLEQLEMVKAVRAAKGEFAASKGALDKYNKSMAQLGKNNTLAAHSLDVIKLGAKAGVTALLALAAAATAGGLAIGHELLKASDFSRRTEKSFDTMLGAVGGAEKGAKALADINEIARDTAQPLEEVSKKFGSLRAAGISQQLAKDLTKMGADFAVIGEEAEAAFGKFTDAVVEGEVTASQFEDISKNLGGKRLFGEALGLSDLALKDTQEGVAQLGIELKALDTQEMLQVAVNVAKAKGELGATSKAAATFGQRLDSLIETAAVDFVKEMGLDSGALEDFFGTLEEFVQSQDFKDFARSTGNALFTLGLVAKDVAGFIIDNWGIIGPILKGVGIAVGVVAAVVVAAAATLMAPLFLLVGVVGLVVGGFVALVDWIVSNIGKVPDAVTGAFNSVVNWFSTLPDRASQFGSDLVDGFVRGINSRVQSAVEAARNMASAVSSTVKSFLQIGSPSKLLEDYGEYTAMGLEGGIESSQKDVAKSAKKLGQAVESGVVDSLGIHSPSKIMEQLGAFTAKGLTVGVNDNAKPVKDSMQSLVTPNLDTPDLTGVLGSLPLPDVVQQILPSISTESSNDGAFNPPSADPVEITTESSGSGLGNVTINIQIDGAKDGAADEFQERLTKVLERVAAGQAA